MKYNTFISKKKYLELCKKEYICIYNQPWFLDTVCGDKNWDVILCQKGEEIVGAYPFYIKRKYGMNYITCPYRVQHNGVWIKMYSNQSHIKKVSYENEIMSAMISKMEEEIHKRKIYNYRQAFSPDIKNWLPFYWKKFKQTTRYTYRINNIQDINDVYKNFFADKKRNIKKAEKSNVTLGFDLDAREFYDFHRECLKEEGKNIFYSFEIFERIYDSLYNHNAGRILYAMDSKGNVLNAMFSGYDERWGYNWYHAISKKARSSGTTDWLVFEMIKYLSSIGVKGFDFEGSMIPGVEESFRHYGGGQEPYFVIFKTYTNNPLVRYFINRKQ